MKRESIVILARHHTNADLISLSETDAHWHALPESEWPADGETPLELRHSAPVRGTYYQQDNQRFYAYWSSDGDFCFRDNNDHVWPLFHRDVDGGIVTRARILTSIAPSLDASGFERAGFLEFTLSLDDKRVFEMDYDARLFRRLYQSETPPSPPGHSAVGTFSWVFTKRSILEHGCPGTGPSGRWMRCHPVAGNLRDACRTDDRTIMLAFPAAGAVSMICTKTICSSKARPCPGRVVKKCSGSGWRGTETANRLMNRNE